MHLGRVTDKFYGGINLFGDLFSKSMKKYGLYYDIIQSQYPFQKAFLYSSLYINHSNAKLKRFYFTSTPSLSLPAPAPDN